MYRLKLVGMEFIKHKLSVFIQMLCLFFGMCVISFFLAQAYNAYKEIKENIDYLKLDNMIIYEHDFMSYEDVFNIDILKDVNRNLGEDITLKFFAREQISQIISNEKLITGAGVFCTNKTTHNIFQGNYMSEGDWTVDEDTCVIGKSIAITNDLKVGGNIYVNNKNYKIEGITDIPNMSTGIYIPYNGKNNLLSNITIYLLNESVNKIDNGLVTKEIRKLGLYNMIDGNTYRNDMLNNLSRGWGFTVVICFLIITYSMFAIYNMIVFALRKNYKKFAVMQSCGASIKDIFYQKLIELTIINLIATIFSSFLIKNIENYALKLGITIRYGYIVSLVNFIIIFIVLLIILFISFRSLLKKSIVEVFQEARKI